MRKKNIHNVRQSSAAGTEDLRQQMDRMKADGYRPLPSFIFPSKMFDGDDSLLGEMNDVMNFAHLGLRQTAGWGHGTDTDNYGRNGGVSTLCPGGFTSAGSEIEVSDVGSPDKGYIQWGANNLLPNWISLAANVLTYTATALKFNIDVASGLGLKPMYRFYSDIAGNANENSISFELAGKMIKQRMIALQLRIFNLTKDHETQSEIGKLEIFNNSDDGEGNEEFDYDGKYFKRIADKNLKKIVNTLESQIEELEADYEIWSKTNDALSDFLEKTNVDDINRKLFTDYIYFGNAYVEFQLSQEGSAQKCNCLWDPTIVSLGHRSALECRKERMGENGVSRYIYLSKKWINPNDLNVSDKIAALPAIDPQHPVRDLQRQIRSFRQSCDAKDTDFSKRPTRFILPISEYTPGRPYYGQKSWWALFNDIYQFASTIIRDRAIRKRNENTFGRIIYVHAEYLDRLVSKINAQNTDEEVERIKNSEIARIKDFLSNKLNNGQTLASCTFTGYDGKDHDAFRVETVPYNTKTAAEADKTEITDVSSIIMFALECHPDLIGSTPGGASSKGGTYQREMLQIKKYKMSQVQKMILYVYETVARINKWDKHLCWNIGERTLTTLDRNHEGEIDE